MTQLRTQRKNGTDAREIHQNKRKRKRERMTPPYAQC